MLPRIAPMIAAALLVALPALSAETSVRLESRDGGLVIEGELIRTVGEFFRLRTNAGTVTVDAGALTCTGPGCPPPDAMTVTASVSGPPDLLTELMAPLMAGFANERGLAFEETFRADDQQTWALVDLETGRTVARFDVGPSDAPDLVVSRLATEPDQLADIIALDAIVPIVAPSNPATIVSTPTLRLLLEGRVTTWPEALTGLSGARAERVALHLPPSLIALGRIWPYTPITPDVAATRHSDPNTLADAVASDDGAIGILPLSRIGNATPLMLAGPCGRVLPATQAMIKSEDYPLTEPIYLERTTAVLPRLVRDFIAFAQSSEAQPIIRRTGLTDQSISRIAFAEQGDRLAAALAAAEGNATAAAELNRMIRALAAGERLTLTFRFDDGAATLDAPSRSNIRQLADAILAGDFGDQELFFAGFTDGQGPFDANLRLSQRRADTVAEAVRTLIGDSDQAIATSGFGETLPMACDDTNWGREINRRVEVWARLPRARP